MQCWKKYILLLYQITFHLTEHFSKATFKKIQFFFKVLESCLKEGIQKVKTHAIHNRIFLKGRELSDMELGSLNFFILISLPEFYFVPLFLRSGSPGILSEQKKKNVISVFRKHRQQQMTCVCFNLFLKISTGIHC